jgi:transcriptional regulator with GAF, ATPase, and Fis domain
MLCLYARIAADSPTVARLSARGGFTFEQRQGTSATAPQPASSPPDLVVPIEALGRRQATLSVWGARCTSADRVALVALAAAQLCSVLAPTPARGRQRTSPSVEQIKPRGGADTPFLEQRAVASMEIVGVSSGIRWCTRQAERVAETDSTVLLGGETGTGKDLFARYVHQRSRRRSRPFVVVDCAALPETLLESELFGHERGAFTGADQRKLGRFETARGGTVFLDEIGELPLHLQGKLLRVLEAGEFHRLGSTETRHADVRIVAATNRDLESSVLAGAFRQDLFFRLNVFPIQVPPLRERREDISLLAHYFLGQMHGRACRIDDAALAAAEQYDWPGNVRELRNVIERAVILATDSTIGLDLPVPGRALPAGGPVPPRALTGGATLAEQVRALKTQAIREALEQASGNRSRAAALLGLDPASLFRMAKRLGLWPMNRPPGRCTS